MDTQPAHSPKRPSRASTLVLTRSEIGALMNPADYLSAVEIAFRALAEGRATAPPPLHIAAEGGGFHAKGAHFSLPDGRAYVAVKVNGNFPGNPARRGLPTIQGAVVLSDAITGEVLALLDSIEITLRRTAAATALALRHMARTEADVATICGCGEQAYAQIEALADVRTLRKVYACDIDAAARERFAAIMTAKLGLEVVPVPEFAPAARMSGIVVTCTTATTPFVGLGDVSPGTFIAAVGADAPHKSEIKPEMMARASLVVDSLEQCRAMGDLRHALSNGAVKDDRTIPNLSDLVVGRRVGRRTADEIALFDSTGLAIQDVAAAVGIYDRARAARVGTSVVLGG